MVREFINYLPSEIVFVIFSKLPIRILAICRCVCKSWRNLVGSHEFVKFHHSQSAAPGSFIAIRKNNKSYKIFESNEQHKFHYMLFTEFNFPHAAPLQGSANGLLFLERCYRDDRRLFICNPITRDYIELPKAFGNGTFATYGFGASRTSGQLKVVGIFHGYKRVNKSGCKRATKSECHVYTLGTTRSWRSIAASSGDPLNYANHMNAGVLVNGNLHWLVRDDDHDVYRKPLISCFDLETEVFSTFPPPPHEEFCGRLCIVGNWLCFCERRDGVMTIWLAKEDKCWTKEFVITTPCVVVYTSYGLNLFSSMYHIKVFGDGLVLIAPSRLYYSTKTKTSQESSVAFHPFMGDAITYTPSFLSLKSFGVETATSF